MPPVAPSPHPGADLVEVVEGALAREAHLFTAGELVVLRALLRLPEHPRELWARLSLRDRRAASEASDRRPEGRGGGARGEGPPYALGERDPADPGPRVFRVAALRYDMDLPGAVAALAETGLAHTTVPDDRCLPAFDVPALRDACKRFGFSTTGPRAALVERLRGQRWVNEPVVMLAHTDLVRRCELLYFQRPYVDRSTLVVERLGQLTWPAYTPTGGPGLFPERAALRRYERARAGEWAHPEEPLELAVAGHHGPLSPWRRAVEAVLAADPPADVLARLVSAGAPVRSLLARRLELDGRPLDALSVCREGDPDRALDIALERTGKRLARGLGAGWVPREPLLAPKVRRLRLPPGPRVGARPTWLVEGETVFVEEAAIRSIAAAGRRAIHAENWLWTSLYALVFRDLYWLPIAGMLPTPRRDGPLDVGTPGFFARRRAAVEARLEQVAREGPAAFTAGWSGERLAGLYAADAAIAACGAIPGPTAAGVLGRLAREGWAAARGLPDLYIFPGPAARIGPAVPARLENGDLLAEIKGPGDSVRDEQRVWHHHMLKLGIPVELWEVAIGSPETG